MTGTGTEKKYHWYTADNDGGPACGGFSSDNLPDNKMIVDATEIMLAYDCPFCNKNWAEWISKGCPFINYPDDNPTIVYALKKGEKHTR